MNSSGLGKSYMREKKIARQRKALQSGECLTPTAGVRVGYFQKVRRNSEKNRRNYKAFKNKVGK